MRAIEMSPPTTLIVGRRYLVGLPPFGMATVEYLGPVRGWPWFSKVRLLPIRRVIWVRTKRLRTLLIALNGSAAAV